MQRIVVGRDVAEAIEHAAADHSLVLMGATEEEILTRLARGTPVLEVIDDLDVSVLMAERARKRSVVEPFFG